jgi:hypothetical protein
MTEEKIPPPPEPDEGQDHEGHHRPDKDKHPDDEPEE